MMKATFKISLCGVALAALASPAWGQDTVSPPPTSEGQAARAGADGQNNVEGGDAGDTIVVTARRRDEDLQDVPLVVNAVTQEEVEKLNLRSFQDVQNLVPGLSLATQANGTGGNVSLRGVNFDVNASGFNPTVEFYLNDAPITSGLVLQSLFDVGQIEVLRGPQGTLRGRASPSGSIILTTRRADLFEAGGNLNVTGNDIGTLNFNGGVGIPIISGVAAIRIAGVYEENDGDRVKTINGSVDGRDPYSRNRGARISGRVQPFDALSLEGTYQKFKRDSNIFNQVASFSEVNPAAPASPVFIRAKDRRSVGSAPERVREDYDVYNGQAQLRLAGQRLIYVFQHYTLAIDALEPRDMGNLFPRADIAQSTRTRGKSTSHEVRLQNDERIFDIFDYVVGGLDLKTNTPTNLLVPTAIALPPFLGGALATVVQTPITRLGQSHEQSVFGNLTAHLGDKIELAGGARYIDNRSTGALIIANTTTIPDPVQDDHHIIYSASAKYSITPDFMVYASTGSSYRPGIFAVGDFSVSQSALERSFLSLPPETSKSYELGFKSTLFDKRLRVNVTGFHQTFKNYPYRAPSPIFYVSSAATPTPGGGVTVTPTVGSFNFVAAVPVRVNGVEGEVAFSASDRWDIGVVASYALGKIRNGVTPCNDLDRNGAPDTANNAPTLAQLQAVVGANNLSACQVTQRSSFSPPFSATVQSEYRIPVSSRVDSYLRGLFTFNGASRADPTNVYDDVGKYGLLNLYAGIRDPKGAWEVSLFGKNVFNTEKAISRSTPLSLSYQVLQPPTFRTTAGVNTTSTYTGIRMTPIQEFGLNLRFNFGSR